MGQRYVMVARKRWQGELDGKRINSAKIWVQVEMDSSRNGESQSAAGVASEEIRLEDVELLRAIEHLPLPLEVELDTVRVSNGKTSRERVVGLRPVARAPAADPKAAK